MMTWKWLRIEKASSTFRGHGSTQRHKDEMFDSLDTSAFCGIASFQLPMSGKDEDLVEALSR